MEAAEIVQHLTERFRPQVTASFPDAMHPRIHLNVENWREIAEFVHKDESLRSDWLANLTAIDYAADQKFCMVYDLQSFAFRHQFAIKVYCDRQTARFPSVVDLWPAANWHEREAYDLFGIDFTGHPNLRRILTAEDWVGHPLRKDYVFPREYQGIPGSVELDWNQHRKAKSPPIDRK